MVIVIQEDHCLSWDDKSVLLEKAASLYTVNLRSLNQAFEYECMSYIHVHI